LWSGNVRYSGGESLKELLSFLKDIVVVVGGLAFLIDYFIRKYLEKYKILFTERAKVSAELYKLLSQMERAHNYSNQIITVKDESEANKMHFDLQFEAKRSDDAFIAFANDNKIWFSKETAIKLDDLCIVLNNIWSDKKFLQNCYHIPDNDTTKTQARKDIRGNIEKMKALKEELENEFRKIIRI
jgi:hypothetical protein